MIETILALSVLVFAPILVALVIVAMTGSKKSSSEGGEKLTLKLPNFDVYKTIKFIAIIVLYILLMWVIKDSFPQLWFWINQKRSLFWAIQGIAICALVILYLSSQKLKVTVVILALIISGIYLWGMFSEEEAYYPEIPQEKIDEFLRNTEPPEELRDREVRGEIWDLKLLWSGEVSMDKWSPVINTAERPPPGQYYIIDVTMPTGRVEVKESGNIIGIYPGENYQPVMKRRPMQYRFRGVDHPKTPIKIWFWKQSKPL